MDYLWLSVTIWLSQSQLICWLEIPRLDPDDPNIKGKNWEAVEKAGFRSRWPSLERNTMAFFLGVFNFEPWHFCHENWSFFHQPVWNDGMWSISIGRPLFWTTPYHLETESVGVALVISWGLNQAIWRFLRIIYIAIKDGAEDTPQML